MVQNPWLAWLFILLLLWSLPWKAMALWRAAKNDQKIWFIIFIIFNSVGILEIIYLFFFSRHGEVSEKLEEAVSPKNDYQKIV